MASYLITGAGRGIGLELTKQLLALPASQVASVFALTRSPPPADLQRLIDCSDGRAVSVIAAVDDTSTLEHAASQVQSHVGTRGLDVLVNNAAMQAQSATGTTDGFTAEQFRDVLMTNVVGVHNTTAAFLPLLLAGTQRKVINVTSTMGSIAWADHFAMAPGQAYKVSKAALHMLNKQYALDYAEHGFMFLCVSPGHLKTRLGGDGDFTVDVGAAELRRIILGSDRSSNGKFLNIHVPGWETAPGRYDGGEVPW